VSPRYIAGREALIPHYTEEQQIGLMALPGALLVLVLTMSVSDPKIRLREVIENMNFVLEVKQAYPDNALIQGVFEDTEIPLRVLHLSSLSDKEAAWRALRLYIEVASAPLGVDTQSTEFRAFLVVLVNKLAEDVETGLFGDDPVMVKVQSDYLRMLEQQFSLVPSHPIDNTLL
jgi:hypothetical protein